MGIGLSGVPQRQTPRDPVCMLLCGRLNTDVSANWVYISTKMTNIFLLHAHGTKEEACVRARG